MTDQTLDTTRRPDDPSVDRLDGDLSVSTIDPVGCPVCGDPLIVELPNDWEDRVAVGDRLELAGCGNPFHYRGLDPDPLSVALDQTLLYDRHDGGVLLPLVAFGCAGMIVGAVIAFIAWRLWAS